VPSKSMRAMRYPVDLEWAAANNALSSAAQLRLEMRQPCGSWSVRSVPLSESRIRSCSGSLSRLAMERRLLEEEKQRLELEVERRLQAERLRIREATQNEGTYRARSWLRIVAGRSVVGRPRQINASEE
jgi:hypothetical protein